MVARATTPPQPGGAWACGPRVLIVEDDPGSRWALCALMRKLGYDCRTATNGREALEVAGSFAPQAILMDVRLPVLDGLEATRRLKADARTRGIPVLALTGYTRCGGPGASRSWPSRSSSRSCSTTWPTTSRPVALRRFPGETGLHRGGPVG
jgi:hypothetical protein